jgi:hypothetical protein
VLALPFAEKSFFTVLTDNSNAGLVTRYRVLLAHASWIFGFLPDSRFPLEKAGYSFSELALLPGGQRLRLNGKSKSFAGLINCRGKGAFVAVKNNRSKG